MAVKGCKQLEWLDMAGQGCTGLEMAAQGWKLLKLAVSGSKWLE